MPHSRGDEAPYWVTVEARPPAPSPFEVPPAQPAPGTWGPPVPRPAPGPSAWCTAALAVAVLSVVVLVAEGVPHGRSMPVSTAAVVLAVTALLVTWDARPTNRWMAVTALLVGGLPLLPYALVLVFVWLLLHGDLG